MTSGGKPDLNARGLESLRLTEIDERPRGRRGITAHVVTLWTNGVTRSIENRGKTAMIWNACQKRQRFFEPVVPSSAR